MSFRVLTLVVAMGAVVSCARAPADAGSDGQPIQQSSAPMAAAKAAMQDQTWHLSETPDGAFRLSTAPALEVAVKMDGDVLTGFLGCNGFRAQLGEVGSKLTIAPPSRSKMACAHSDFENRYIGWLQQIDGSARDGDALMLMSGGKALLQYQRVDAN